MWRGWVYLAGVAKLGAVAVQLVAKTAELAAEVAQVVAKSGSLTQQSAIIRMAGCAATRGADDGTRTDARWRNAPRIRTHGWRERG